MRNGWDRFIRPLGLSVGVVTNDMDTAQRQEMYDCDITYVTNNELGFDYLRDNMVTDKSQLVQRELNYAIVDEVDSVLIDEARTPLIISARVENLQIYIACAICLHAPWKEARQMVRFQDRCDHE